MKWRIVLDIILCISVFLLPWWVTAFLVCVGIFVWDNFYEAFIIAIITFAVYRVPESRFIASTIWFPIFIVGCFLSIKFLKRFLIIYKNEI